MLLKSLSLITVCSPLLGCLIAGMAGRLIGKRGAHWVTISLMSVSLISALILLEWVVFKNNHFNGVIYTWGTSGHFHFDIGFMIDRLSVVMMVMITFVSMLVHLYSVGYMSSDPGNQRFFSYVSLFTFAMLLLVTANNFFQLFMGWEGVGLVSYLLIGFWFHKESAAFGSLKAFIVNRIGDCGLILGIAAVLDYFGTLNYSTVFAKAPTILHATLTLFPGCSVSVITMICILLFIGAMGKSAQVPLHIWLPESMEGPTPISALIHAATMVTAGVFMVARLSPLFVWSPTALSMVLVIGATGALFTGLLAFVENDIKRVVAYSTMSQLGYMMAANGVGAFNASIFHLLTHACFKALLFLSSGAVIIAMHHNQDLRHMGNLRKYMPVTYLCFLIGALSLSAIPPFSGYYSKDSIIEAVHLSTVAGAQYGYWCLLLGAFVTSFYIFRAFFMAFHTKERMSETLRSDLVETRWTMMVPMIGLALPSIFLGAILVNSILYKTPGLLGFSVATQAQHSVLIHMASVYHGVIHQALHSIFTEPFWFSVGGIFLAWWLVIVMPSIRNTLAKHFSLICKILIAQYGFNWLSNQFVVPYTQRLARLFFQTGDLKIIDYHLVEGSGRGMTRIAQWLRRLQSGYLYHYAFVMIVSLLALLFWLLW